MGGCVTESVSEADIDCEASSCEAKKRSNKKVTSLPCEIGAGDSWSSEEGYGVGERTICGRPSVRGSNSMLESKSGGAGDEILLSKLIGLWKDGGWDGRS